MTVTSAGKPSEDTSSCLMHGLALEFEKRPTQFRGRLVEPIDERQARHGDEQPVWLRISSPTHESGIAIMVSQCNREVAACDTVQTGDLHRAHRATG